MRESSHMKTQRKKNQQTLTQTKLKCIQPVYHKERKRIRHIIEKEETRRQQQLKINIKNMAEVN